jgi:hypothetical protein
VGRHLMARFCLLVLGAVCWTGGALLAANPAGVTVTASVGGQPGNSASVNRNGCQKPGDAVKAAKIAAMKSGKRPSSATPAPENVGSTTVTGVAPGTIDSGTAVTLCFSVTVNSPDSEYIEYFSVDLPDGWTVNSVTNAPDTGCGNGTTQGVAAGNVVFWQDVDYPPATGCGSWDNGTYSFCCNVTAPSCAGSPYTLNWSIIGDGWGGTPHSASGTVGPINCNVGAPVTLSTPDDTQEACPGTGVVYPFTVVNNTGAAATFAITSQNNTWPLAYPGTVGPVNDGASANFDVTHTIPAAAPGGSTDSFDIIATSGPNSALKGCTTTASTTQAAPVPDGSFEAGTPNPNWAEGSTNFGTPLCDAAGCGTGGGTAGPRTGSWWTWFGGTTSAEVGYVEQNVTVPASLGATLNFYIWNGSYADTSAYFRCLMDGDVLLTVVSGDPAYTGGYTLVSVDITAYADGGSHLLRFDSTKGSGLSYNLCLDDVSMTAACPANGPLIHADGSALTAEGCPPPNGVIDPNEMVTVSFGLKNVGTEGTTDLVATLQTTGGVTSPGAPQTYGALAPGDPTVSRPFTFRADPALACGGTLTATLQLQDGATDLGTLTFNFTLGVLVQTVNPAVSNPAAITIPSSGAATPYPSPITVSGLTGSILKVTATLTNMNHTWPDDVNVLLVGPLGQKMVLMQNAGSSYDLVNVTLTFDDAAAASLPDSTQITAGTYKPTQYSTAPTYPAPAPAGPYATTLSAFNGTDPNGTWNLYAMDDASGDSGNINGGWSLTITTSDYVCCICPTITLSPATLPDGTVGTAYSQTITGAGGTAPYTFTVTAGSTPAGLNLAAGGALTGTPTTVGTSNFTVTATDDNGCSGTQDYSITVACPTVTLSPATLPNGTLGSAYSQAISASGGTAPYTFAVMAGALPGGLNLASDGTLSGTPTALGTSSFTVTATDNYGCTGSLAYSMEVVCPAIALSPTALPGGAVGSAYSQTITASGGTAPYTFAVTAGSAPTGLTLSSGGTLSGTPTAVGTYTFTVTATDNLGCTGTYEYIVVISPAGTGGTSFLDNYGRAKMCVDTASGAYTWTILTGLGAGTSYSGTAVVTDSATVLKLASPSGATPRMFLNFYKGPKTATGSLVSGSISSSLIDSNTDDNPPATCGGTEPTR